MVTEDQVRAGLSNFKVLVDSEDVSRMQAALYHQQKEQEKAEEHKRLTQCFRSQEIPPSKDEGGTQERIGAYMLASIAPYHKEVDNVIGLTDRAERL